MQPIITAFAFVFGHLLSLIVTALTCYVIGRYLSFRIPFTDRSERSVIALTLGLGALGTLIFLVGLLDLLWLWVVLGLILAIHILARPVWREIWGDAREIWDMLSKHAALKILVFVLVIGPMTALALYPPTQFDATLYHLPFADSFIEHHGLCFLPDLRFPVFPQLMEMLFVLGMFGGGEVGAQLNHHLCLLLTATILIAWGRSAGSTSTGIWAAALWLGTPLVVYQGGAAYVDLGLSLFVTAAFFAWYRWRQSDNITWLLLSAVLVGFAAGTKYLGLFFVATLVAATFMVCAPKRRWKPIAVFPAVTAALLAPWYLRIVMLTGNPVFPFYPELFGASPWAAPAAAAAGGGSSATVMSMLSTQAKQVLHGLGFLIMVPYNAVFDRQIFNYQAPLSPWFLILIPIFAIPALRSPKVRALVLVILSYALFWLTTIRDIRFLLPVLPMLCLALMIGTEMIGPEMIGTELIRPRHKRVVQSMIVALVAMALLAPGWMYAAYKTVSFGPPPLTEAQREIFLGEHVPGYTALSLLNHLHGREYTVYALGGANLRYYAEGRFVGDVFGPARHARILHAAVNGQRLHQALEELGADYLLVCNSKMAAKLPQDQYFADHFRQMEKTADFILFEIRGSSKEPVVHRLAATFGCRLAPFPLSDS